MDELRDKAPMSAITVKWVGVVDTVDADDIASSDVRPDERHEHVGDALPLNTTSMAPPIPTIEAGRPLAYVVTAPVCGSTRETRPVESFRHVERLHPVRPCFPILPRGP